MRTIWKRAAYLTLLTAGIAMTVVSCTDTATSPPSSQGAPGTTGDKEADDLRSRTAWAGDYHTRALAHSYKHLMKHNTGSLSPASKCKLAEAALQDFTRSYRRNGRSLSVSDVSMAGTACDNSVRKQIVDGPGPSTSRRSTELSAGASALMAQIESMSESSASVDAIRAAIRDTQNNAATTLDESEAGAVIAAGELAISSVEYWNANLPAWESGIGADTPVAYSRLIASGNVSGVVLGAPGTTARSGGASSRVGRVIKADVSAFVVSVAASWWIGPVAWELSAVKAAAASIVAGLFPY